MPRLVKNCYCPICERCRAWDSVGPAWQVDDLVCTARTGRSVLERRGVAHVGDQRDGRHRLRAESCCRTWSLMQPAPAVFPSGKMRPAGDGRARTAGVNGRYQRLGGRASRTSEQRQPSAATPEWRRATVRPPRRSCPRCIPSRGSGARPPHRTTAAGRGRVPSGGGTGSAKAYRQAIRFL